MIQKRSTMNTKHNLIRICLMGVALGACWQNARAQTAQIQTIYSFIAANGRQPEAGLCLGPDGNFYGTASIGGSNNDGTVFRVTTNGVLTALVSFNGTNGAQPYAGLTLGNDGNLYGTTLEGGNLTLDNGYGYGTLFRITTNGVLTTLVSFAGTNGSGPSGLTLGNDGSFYGTAEGTLFRVTTNGVLTTLGSGVNSAGVVFGNDGNLYGTTSSGGSSGYGTVFRVTTNGVLTTLASFAGGANGWDSSGLTLGADGNFYGTTEFGGLVSPNDYYGYGTLFRVTTNGALTTLVSFGNTNGSEPIAALTLGTDGNFYGTTQYGGIGYGTAFRVTTNGVLTSLASFAGTNGDTLVAGLTQGSDGNFYGTTEAGGRDSYGSVFQVTTNGALTSLASFTAAYGEQPMTALTLGNDGAFYGTTPEGGSNGDGTVFRVTTNGTLTTLFSFDGTNYTCPKASLTLGNNGNFYGITLIGGGSQVMFQMTTNGVITTLVSMTANGLVPSEGYLAEGALALGKDGNFYGTAYQGGSSGEGAVFRVTTNGNVTTLVSFTATSGDLPQAGLTLGSDGSFYGTTSSGGSGGDGTVFRVTTNGALATVVAFTNTDRAQDPAAGLTLGPDGNFYGTTYQGGSNADGAVFRVTINGVLISLASFAGTNGEYPYAGLTLGNDGNFYGTTEYGGSGDNGTVFRATTNGALTSLVSFNGTDGYEPRATLTLGPDGNFYGTTFTDTGSGLGTIFRVVVPSPPFITSLLTNEVVSDGSNVVLSIAVSGVAPFSYQWYFDGLPLNYGTNATLAISNFSLANAGSYSVAVTNALGGVVSPSFIVSTPDAPVLTVLASFTGANGENPDAGLTLGANGIFYGTTFLGGSGNAGTVFRVTTNGALTTLTPFSFSGTNGSELYAGLALGNDGNFYGATESGGTYYGTLYRVTTNGALTTLVTFATTNGSSPIAGLTLGADGNFYGTTAGGGSSVYGTVFRVTTNGVLTTLVSFSGANGSDPWGGLTLGPDGNFYGTTQQGGSSGLGTVFQITTNGALTTLASFTGANGQQPVAALTLGPDGNFYGTTAKGGASGNGTVFQVTTSGALTTLVSFANTNGANPQSALTLGNDGNFCGTTEAGGSGGYGTVFRVTTNGALTTLLNFVGANGANPIAGLTLGSDGNFYGTTYFGGSSNLGVVFQMIIPSPAIISQLTNKVVTDGVNATFSVAVSGTAPFRYQWYFNGAPLSYGTSATLTLNDFSPANTGSYYVAVTNAAGGVVSQPFMVSGVAGPPPLGIAMINNLPLAIWPSWATNYVLEMTTNLASGNWVMVTNGLSYYGAQVTNVPGANAFQWQGFTNGAQAILTVLASFNGTNGAYPQGALTLGNDGNFYGTTAQGGSNSDGTVFQMTTNGGLATVVNFDGADGQNPVAGLTLAGDGNFYGATGQGGGGGFDGTIFRVTTSGALTTLFSFPYSAGQAPNGSDSWAALTLGPDGSFYGTTYQGGCCDDGTVFRVTTNGALTTLVSFTEINGAGLFAGLTLGNDGNFYGTTGGGGSNGCGTVFRVTTNGALTSLVSFTGANGTDPMAGLALGADGNFYGTTYVGGNLNFNGGNGDGTVFRMTPGGLLTALVSFANTNGANPQAGLTLGNDGSFYGTTCYGGANGAGTVFRVTTNGTLTTLASFANANGANPQANLTLGNDGNFYGTTCFGGSSDLGAAFCLSIPPALAATSIGNPPVVVYPAVGSNFTLQASTNAASGDWVTVSNGVPYVGLQIPNLPAKAFFRLAIPSAPVITSVLTNEVVTDGANATLSVAVSGTAPFSYQWYFDGAPLSYGTNATLTLTNFSPAAAGSYSVAVSNAAGGVASQSFTVSGAAAPPSIGIAMESKLPVLVWPASATNSVLQMATNLAAGHWLTVTNGIPYFGVQVTNVPGAGAFQLEPTQAVLTLLASFETTNGAAPYAGVALGNDGNFYGTTYAGGSSGDGTVFCLKTNGALTALVSFQGTNGAAPNAALTLGPDGNFYGTTEGNNSGVTGGNGTVFRVTTNGALTTLVLFSYSNGQFPVASLTLGPDGNFYGTTVSGGTSGDGTIFRVTTNGALTTLASFANTNGWQPWGGLALGLDGNFYGTTAYGGNTNLNGGNGVGTVFRVTSNGLLTLLAPFTGANGQNPLAGLTLGNDGSFYGTTASGGNNGTVFRVTTNGALTTLASFNSADGAVPTAGLTLGNDGNFYGTTTQGGTYDEGAVFRVTTSGALTLLASFANTNGTRPTGLTLGNDGNFYGTTEGGGDSGNGCIFRLSIPPSLAVATIGSEPVVVYPAAGTNFTLQASTNAASGNWVTVSNGIPYVGLQITNAPGTAFFRLQ
jgi:uncharacterized repeat protein (TIGR03803 family)